MAASLVKIVDFPLTRLEESRVLEDIAYIRILEMTQEPDGDVVRSSKAWVRAVKQPDGTIRWVFTVGNQTVELSAETTTKKLFNGDIPMPYGQTHH